MKKSLLQLVVNFVIPIYILTKFSSVNALGPTKAMLIALAFPVAYEIVSIRKSRKPSIMSLISIGGILVTGVISLFGLSEGWLAVRRSLPYLAGSIAIIVSIRIKRPLIGYMLPHMLDMDRIHTAAKKAKSSTELTRVITVAGYLSGALLGAITVVSYALTRVVITAATNTEVFNQEYAKLRIVSLPAVSLPLIMGFVAIIMYLLTRIEKLTGIDGEELLKKKA
jgi:hypothetical protein